MCPQAESGWHLLSCVGISIQGGTGGTVLSSLELCSVLCGEWPASRQEWKSRASPPPPAGQGDGSGGWAWEGPPGTRVTVGTREALCPPSAGTGLAGSLEIRRHKRLRGCRDAAISHDPVPLAVRSRDASPALPHLLQDGGLGNGPMLASTEPRRPPPLGCRCVTL